MSCLSTPGGQEKLIEINGNSLWVSLLGKGNPAVIFESGVGDGGSFCFWNAVQKAVSRKTQTVVYDRAGIGASGPVSTPPDTEQVAAELHALLDTVGINPPYILVGHSMGGLHVQVFAQTWPDDVAGIVLVDPSPKQLLAPLGSEKLSILKDAGVPEGSIGELTVGLNSSLKRFALAEPVPTIPLTVISSSYTEDLTGEVTFEKYQQLLTYHQQLADSVKNGKHIVATKSGHYIQIDQPKLVIKAVLDMFAQVAHRTAY